MLNEEDEHGFSLIHYFALVDYHDSIRLLAENGANINILSSSGNSSSLLLAATRGNEQSVQVLLKCGASLQVSGQSPDQSER